METAWAAVLKEARPPTQPVKVLPSRGIKLTQADLASRRRAALWIYGGATVVALACLQCCQICKRCRKGVSNKAKKEERQARALFADSPEQPLIAEKEKDQTPAEDIADEETEGDEVDVDLDRAHRFVAYHMAYTLLGIHLVLWASRHGYLNIYGLDWELYSFWFLESVLTHLLCRATPQQFLRSVCPILSERYDLVKDTVSIGIYANLDSMLGYSCTIEVDARRWRFHTGLSF
eukprot:s308_g56.t1